MAVPESCVYYTTVKLLTPLCFVGSTDVFVLRLCCGVELVASSIHKTLGSSLALHKPGMVAHAVISALTRRRPREKKVKAHPERHDKAKASLACMEPYQRLPWLIFVI